MNRTNYKTVVVDDRGQTEYSDWATDEADLFRQYDEIFRGWKLISKDEAGRIYTISYEKIQ